METIDTVRGAFSGRFGVNTMQLFCFSFNECRAEAMN